jgi:hypothetical protein
METRFPQTYDRKESSLPEGTPISTRPSVLKTHSENKSDCCVNSRYPDIRTCHLPSLNVHRIRATSIGIQRTIDEKRTKQTADPGPPNSTRSL